MTSPLARSLALLVALTATARAGPVQLGVTRGALIALDDARAVVLGDGGGGRQLVAVDLASGAVAWRVDLGTVREHALLGGHFVSIGDRTLAVELATGKHAAVEGTTGTVVVTATGLLVNGGRELRRVPISGGPAWTCGTEGVFLGVAPAGEGATAVVANGFVGIDRSGAVAWNHPRAGDLLREVRLVELGDLTGVVAGRQLWVLSAAGPELRGPIDLLPADGKAKVTFEVTRAPRLAGAVWLFEGVHKRFAVTKRDGRETYSSSNDATCVLVDVAKLKVAGRFAAQVLTRGADAILVEVTRERHNEQLGMSMPSVGTAAYDLKGKRLWEVDFIVEAVTSAHYGVLELTGAKPPWGLSVHDIRRARRVGLVPIPEEHLRAAAERVRAGDLGARGAFGCGALHADAGVWVRSQTLLRAARHDALGGPFVELTLPAAQHVVAAGLTPGGRLVALLEDGTFVAGAGR